MPTPAFLGFTQLIDEIFGLIAEPDTDQEQHQTSDEEEPADDKQN